MHVAGKYVTMFSFPDFCTFVSSLCPIICYYIYFLSLVLFCLSDFSIGLWTCSNNVVFCFILYCFLRLLFYIYLTIFSVQIPNVCLLICLLSISILYINRYRYMSVYERLDYKLSHITRMFTLYDSVFQDVFFSNNGHFMRIKTYLKCRTTCYSQSPRVLLSSCMEFKGKVQRLSLLYGGDVHLLCRIFSDSSSFLRFKHIYACIYPLDNQYSSIVFLLLWTIQ